MGRRSIASGILEDLEDENTEEGCYLVLYDFISKPSKYFYRNFNVIKEATLDGVRIQKSVVQCRMLKTARAIEKLAQHYEAKVLVFKVEKELSVLI